MFTLTEALLPKEPEVRPTSHSSTGRLGPWTQPSHVRPGGSPLRAVCSRNCLLLSQHTSPASKVQIPGLTLNDSVSGWLSGAPEGVLRFLALVFALVSTWIFIRSYISLNAKTIRLPRWLSLVTKEILMRAKCGLAKPCPKEFFAFKISSGAANVVGPTMCFENQVIMSPVKNNVGRGLNIALVNGTTGMVLTQKCFDMYSGEVKLLVKFLKEIPEGALVLVASYDDPGTRLNDETRKLLSSLGSSYAKQLGFRDSWVFLGAKDLKDKSPFEQLRAVPKCGRTSQIFPRHEVAPSLEVTTFSSAQKAAKSR
ncbi:protein FAM3D isoform X2 [Panthera leo]|uniref:protein FAM3D isoform X2 n=1 Tax=Panthera leo TaxID=9689 RepID=UPI001C695E5D|nr:protein FAM3D isoform X2 [Panthera leo]